MVEAAEAEAAKQARPIDDISADPELELQREDWLRCESSCRYFVSEHVKIEERHDPRYGGTVARSDVAGEVPFRLWPGCPGPDGGPRALGQTDVLDLFEQHRFRVVLKSRQLGLSWLAIARAVWKCLTRRSHLVLCYSATQEEANELVHRARFIYDHLPSWMRHLKPLRSGAESVTTIGWSNGSTIKARAATKAAGRALTASEVIMDEAAWMVNARALYLAAMRMAEAGGEMTIISTANGQGGLFYDVWQSAYSGLSDFKAIFLPWWVRPGRDKAWYDSQVRNADDPALIPQELPASPEEAFVSSGRVRFHPAWTTAQALNVRAETIPREYWPDLLRSLDLRGQKNRLEIFALPDQRQTNVIGADCAEGIPGGDYDDAVVVDEISGEEIAVLHGRWEADEYASMLFALSQAYNAPLGVERNNHGHAVLLALRKLIERYQLETPRYIQKYTNPDTKILLGHDGRPGWVTSSGTKDLMITALAEALRDQTLTIRSRLTLSQLQDYRYLKNGSLGCSPGRNDDIVMAHAVRLGLRKIGKTRDVGFAEAPDIGHRG